MQFCDTPGRQHEPKTARPRRVLFVTGVSGDLGRELARRAPVVGTVLSRAAPEALRTHRVDVRNAHALRAALEAERPQVVIHTAYRQDDDSVTRDGSAVVAAEAARIGARLLHNLMARSCDVEANLARSAICGGFQHLPLLLCRYSLAVVIERLNNGLVKRRPNRQLGDVETSVESSVIVDRVDRGRGTIRLDAHLRCLLGR
jgi:hypothetical protein